MRTFESTPCIYLAIFLSTIFCVQYNLISRIDDASKLLKDNIIKNPKVEHQQYWICTRLCWGKNVTEERDAPLQIVLGASHPLYCALMRMGTWLEERLSQGHKQQTQFTFGYDGYNDEDSIKNKASSAMIEVLKDPSFVVVLDGPKGTHSIQKMATQEGRKRGLSLIHI